MLSGTNHDGPAFNTRSRTAQHTPIEDPTLQPQSDAVTPDVTDTPSTTQTTDHRYITGTPTNVENRSIL